jgi:hypothetical protein
MAGSDANYLSKALGDLAFGKTAYAGETTIYGGLWTAALDDTFAGNTAPRLRTPRTPGCR